MYANSLIVGLLAVSLLVAYASIARKETAPDALKAQAVVPRLPVFA
jgi:hypothetical protein